MTDQLTLVKGENIPETKPKVAARAKARAAAANGDKLMASLLSNTAESAPLPPMDGPVAGDEVPPDTKVPPEPEPVKLDGLLLTILQTRRAHQSVGDTNFRIWLHSHLKKLGKEPKVMAEGCVVVRTDEKSDTLFSCHMDTVHSSAESNGQFQKLSFDPNMGHLMLDPQETSGCLGADDGAGIYLMLKMIEGNVPGTYIFHAGEEKGGIGARAMRSKHLTFFDDFSRAIAFDRADNYEVICSQGGQACASVAAGLDLARALNEHGFQYEVSHKGSFTDTKVYAPLIPECFNLGVGYMWQHSANEYLDVNHLNQLLQACLSIQWDKLVVQRKPVSDTPTYTAPKGGSTGSARFPGFENEDREIYGSGSSYGSYGGQAGHFDKHTKSPAPAASSRRVPTRPSLEDLVDEYDRDDIISLVEESPDVAADLMCVLLARYRGALAEAEVLSAFFGA